VTRVQSVNSGMISERAKSKSKGEERERELGRRVDESSPPFKQISGSRNTSDWTLPRSDLA
jgi:hypothetical protein